MIARSEDIGAEVEKLVCNLRRNSEAARGVFSIDNQQFDIVSVTHMADVLADNLAPRTPKDVSHKQDVQAVIPVPCSFFSDSCSFRIRGKRITSRMDLEPVSNITSLSMPMPSPPVGGSPYASART